MNQTLLSERPKPQSYECEVAHDKGSAISFTFCLTDHLYIRNKTFLSCQIKDMRAGLYRLSTLDIGKIEKAFFSA